MKVDKKCVEDYLSANAVDKYYIEYVKFFSNHLAHAAVALYKLGDEQDHFEKYLDNYKKKLESPTGKARAHQDSNADVADKVEELVGKRKGYYKILEHYKSLLKDVHGGSLDSLLKAEYPKLSAGVIGAAFHPLIHIGYGYSIENAGVVLEGLAYLHHSQAPPAISDKSKLAEFGSGDVHDMIDLAEDLRKDSSFLSKLMARADELHALKDGRLMFDCKLASALERGDEIMAMAMRAAPPKGQDVAHWMVEQAVRIYLAAEEKNDFFLLHGITSSWALKQILPCLDEKDRKVASAYMAWGLLGIYLEQGPHVLDKSRLASPDIANTGWEELISIPLKKGYPEVDEHVFKLVQVCFEQSQKSGHAKEGLYKLACQVVQSGPYFFFKEGSADAKAVREMGP